MKNAIIALILALYINGLNAQTQYGNEWRIHAGGGGSMFKFNSDLMMNEKENIQAGFGGNLGIDYVCFFSPYWGVSLGMEAAMYTGSIPSLNVHTEQQIETPPGLTGNFFLRTDYNGIVEKQTAAFLQLPILLHFRLPVGKHFFRFAAGAKYGIPLSASYKQTIDALTTYGYSDDFRQDLSDMPNHGFETRYNVQLSDKLKLKSGAIFALETGFQWQIAEKSGLYTGVYLDAGYGLGIKLGLTLGSGRKFVQSATPKALPEKPLPLLGD